MEEYVRACEENEPMDDIARRKELVEFLLEQPGIRLDASNKVLQSKIKYYFELFFFRRE